MKLTKIAVAMGLAFGAASVFADDVKNPNTPTPQRSQGAGGGGPGSSALDPTAGAFWTENSRNGQLTKEQAMKYKDNQGKTPDMTKLDADKDSKISEAEWTRYHTITVTQVAPGVVVVDPDTFWVKNAKSGHLTRDQVMSYMDTDKDGRVSKEEWQQHTAFAGKAGGPERAGPAGQRGVVNDPNAHWSKHSKGGYMTRDQAMKYNGPEGTAMNFERLDADKDGRVSQPEWTKYHISNPLKSDGARDAGYDDRQSPGGPAEGPAGRTAK